jgi:hypothetical protein
LHFERLTSNSGSTTEIQVTIQVRNEYKSPLHAKLGNAVDRNSFPDVCTVNISADVTNIQEDPFNYINACTVTKCDGRTPFYNKNVHKTAAIIKQEITCNFKSSPFCVFLLRNIKLGFHQKEALLSLHFSTQTASTIGAFTEHYINK